MATKKLKAELELETAKAKRQAKELEQTGGSGSGGSGGAASGASKLGKALDKASKSAEKSAGAFDQMQGRAAQLTKGFAGIAVGMATSYASNYVTNPNAKAGLDYAGAGISGAVGGAMVAGIPGAIVGGLAGVLKTYMEKEGERSQMSKDFETGEAIYAGTRRDEKKFESLSMTKQGTDIAGNLATVKEILDNYAKTADEFVREIREELAKANPDKELLAKLQRNLNYSRQQISKYEGLQKTLESVLEKGDGSGRAYYSGTDSLMKIGGGGGGAVAEILTGGVGPKPKSALPNISFGVESIRSSTRSFGEVSFGDATDQAMKQAQDRIEKIDADQLKVLNDIADSVKRRRCASWQ